MDFSHRTGMERNSEQNGSPHEALAFGDRLMVVAAPNGSGSNDNVACCVCNTLYLVGSLVKMRLAERER